VAFQQPGIEAPRIGGSGNETGRFSVRTQADKGDALVGFANTRIVQGKEPGPRKLRKNPGKLERWILTKDSTSFFSMRLNIYPTDIFTAKTATIMAISYSIFHQIISIYV
jgi:hypothetical protein